MQRSVKYQIGNLRDNDHVSEAQGLAREQGAVSNDDTRGHEAVAFESD